AADIRRMLALLRVPAEPDIGGIAVETVMRFMTKWLLDLEVLDTSNEVSEAAYHRGCSAANELIAGGAISGCDLTALVARKSGLFDFDAIVADEAQDWPQSEGDLLKRLYGPRKLALADGLDQLIRGPKTDWTSDVSKEISLAVPLKRSL